MFKEIVTFQQYLILFCQFTDAGLCTITHNYMQFEALALRFADVLSLSIVATRLMVRSVPCEPRYKELS